MSDEHDPVDTADQRGGYYYDVATGEVSEGRTHGWQHRMGPYATREEAARALATARERTRAWDEEDERDR